VTTTNGTAGVLIRRNTTKTRKPVWHDLPDALADAIEAALPPREDRNPAARLFAGSGADALRTAMAKACAAAGIPHFHPHDLRHRRISVMANAGVPAIRCAEFVGQRNLGVTWETYTHLMHDRTEVVYGRLLTEAGLLGRSP
jgi:integrase